MRLSLGLGLTSRRSPGGVPWALDAAVTNPVTLTMADSGKAGSTGYVGGYPTPGDNPVGFSTPFASTKGNFGGNEYMAFLTLPVSPSLTAAVHYAELRVQVGAFSDGVAPSVRVRAMSAAAPTSPASGDYPLQTGTLTTAYTAWDPLVSETGIHRIDVTGVVNELVAAFGSITAIQFVFDVQTSTATDCRFTWATFATYAPRMVVYPSVNHRDYQTTTKAAISNGTAVYFWPFDATDIGAGGALSTIRPVITGTPTTLNTSDLDMTLVGVPSAYSGRIDAGAAELSNNNARKLVAPYNSGAGDYFYSVDMDARDYLIIVQSKHVAGKYMSWEWDNSGILGMITSITEDSGSGQWRYQWPNGLEQSGTLPQASRNVSGEIHTLCYYLDHATATVHIGYCNGDEATGIVWAANSVTLGAGAAQLVSGIAYADAGQQYQGVLGVELTTGRRLSEIKAACSRARALWKAGIKAIPPMLIA